MSNLMWNDQINASALYRRALREEMNVRDVDPDELRDLLERAREQGYTLDEIAENTNRFGDLQALAEDQQNRPRSSTRSTPTSSPTGGRTPANPRTSSKPIA